MSTSAPSQSEQAVRRVVAYIDGFNVYYGLQNASRDSDKLWVKNGGRVEECLGRSLYWLDLQKVIVDTLRPHEHCLKINYFSAPRKIPRRCRAQNEAELLESNKRQMLYIDALRTLPLVEVTLGWYVEKTPHACPECGHRSPRWEEKATDVGIATAMLRDAFRDRFDLALLLSADADLVPPVEETRSLGKSVMLLLFPGRTRADRLKQCVDIVKEIRISDLRSCVMPPVVSREGLKPLVRPDRWDKPRGWVWGNEELPEL